MTLAAMKGTPVASLAAGSTSGTGVAISIPNSSKDCNFYLAGTGTIAAGTVLVEEADDPTYTGTWSTIDDIDCAALTGGGQSVLHVAGMLRAVRMRLSVAVTGGGSVIGTVVCS